MLSPQTTERLRRAEGQVTVLFALMLTALLAGGAFAVDIGRGYFAQRSLQASADASALAAAQGLPNIAQAVALGNAYGGADGGVNAAANVPGVNSSVTPKCLGSCTGPNAVVVTEDTHMDTIFGRVIGVDSMGISVKATACAGIGAAYLIANDASTCTSGGGGGSTTSPTTTTAATTTAPPPTPGKCTLGYPYLSNNPLTTTIFSESTVLRAFAPAVATGAGDTIKVWYNDEHALTLGVRQVVVKTTTGTTTTNFPVAALPADPGSAANPAVGSTTQTGDLAGTDTTGRPMYPALFVTDITANPSDTSGDWQFGGVGLAPTAIFGTWKGAVVTVDKTKSPATRAVTPDADPRRKNNWSLGTGSDTPPAGLSNEGFGAEAVWSVGSLGLKSGHYYRMEFMVHDGDQNKSGGDAGEACNTVLMP
ncbi:MAG: pilus assembly protein TadG-related protein [Gaiellaceae bacterium]